MTITPEGTPAASRLLVEERRRKVLEIVEKQGRAAVDDLVERFGVSAVTVRSDLEALARIGAIVRSRGGALKPGWPLHDIPLRVKETLHHAEKVRIGQAAARMIGDTETIILDSGSTTVEIARQLRFRRLKALTVITNALNIATELAGVAHIRVMMLGGMVRPMSYSLVGQPAEETLQTLYADRLFLGVDGFDPEIGITTPDVQEARLNALMIRAAREVIAVTDASKFGRLSLSVIAPIESIHKVITDEAAGPDLVAALRAKGVEVILV